MISEYNNVVCQQLSNYVNFFIERVAASRDDGTDITLDKYVIVDTNNFDVNYLMMRGMTGVFTVKFYFKIKDKNGTVYESTEDIEVPKMVNNVFVIEGALRIPTNTLDNDDAVTVYNENIRINEMVNIDFVEDSHEPGGYKLTAFIYLDEEPISIDCSDANLKKYSKHFKLSDSEIDKLKVKLDTDDVGEYLTRDLILKLVERGPDRYLDSMIDKKIYSAEANLMKYLWSRDVRKKILSEMKSKYYQYNRIYLRGIQSAMNRYFKIASEKNIDIPNTVNPLVFDAMKFKIRIPENVAYNQSMTDIIDVANTPINQHVNSINELNVCASVKEGVIYIKCYTYPDQTPIEVPYTRYCTKKVLVNQYWDYENKKFIEGTSKIRYKLRMKYHEGTTDESFDFIEPKADDKLSITTRRIPMGNMSDSVRIAMGATMMKQAVEIDQSEPSLVTPGYDDTDFELSTLVTRYVGPDGVVDKIKDSKIFIKEKQSGSVQFYEIPSPTPGANDSVISFDAAVKENQDVVNGSILVVPHMSRRKSFELGLNSNVIYMNYLGYTHEDGIVISESYADRLTHYSIIDVYKELYPDDIVSYIKRVGSKITSKDVLVNNQTRLRVNPALKDTFGGGGLLSGMGISFNQSNLVVPNNIDEGYILDCKIEFHPDRGLTNEKSRDYIEGFLKEPKSEEYEFLPKKYKDQKANPIDIRDRVSGYISYKILRVDRCRTGDKMTNRYGSKGIISLILPDKCMPHIVYSDGTRKPAEILLNPASVLHRKNLSQIYECSLGKCVVEIYRKVSNYIKDDRIDKAKSFLKQFYGNKFSNMTDDEFVKNHNQKNIYAYRMEVGFFSKVTHDTVIEWMKMLGINEKETIYCPDIVIAETADGRKGFLSSEVDPMSMPGAKVYELGYCDQPCITGQEYMMKLWKQAMYDGKVTSEVMETEEPIMGKGKYRWEGQKIGEMELWILLETGTDKFLTSQSDTMLTSQYVFLNELLLSGYYIQDQQGAPVLSHQRTRVKQLEELGK